MTFFAKDKKSVSQIIKNKQKIGPGAYTPQKQQGNNQAYAPFGSLGRKQNTVKSSLKQPVGPGSYNISKDIIKPSIMQYENQNCIIIKINQQGNSQFKSKIQRFKQDNGIVQTPGPGSYDWSVSQLQKQNNKNRKRTLSVGQSFHKMKQLYSSQYKQKRKPTLSSDKPQIQQNQKTDKKEAVKGILRWDLNKKQRFHSEPKQYMSQKDKSILIQKTKIQNKKMKQQKKQSCFFASKSVKSCFDEIVYKSTNPFKVEIRKMLGYQDQSPGPGSYDPSIVKHDKKSSNFQFFGSTVDRFNKSQSTQPNIGPGDYQTYSKNIQKSISKPKKLRRPSKKTITQPDEQQSINLGPGAYNVNSNSNIKPTFNLKLDRGEGYFGSYQPRFEPIQKPEKPQKSEYLSFMAQEDEQRKKRIQAQFNMRRNLLKNKNYSIFVSESKRNCFQNMQSVKNNPFGLYQIGSEDIGTRIKKKKQLIQQFAQCNLTKPGFLSQVQRFKTQKQQQSTHKDCWCQIKEVQKKNIQHQSPAFQSNSLRTQVFLTKNKGPAVGQYNNQSSFIKSSFNSKFIKQNENRMKKIKIWKTKQ